MKRDSPCPGSSRAFPARGGVSPVRHAFPLVHGNREGTRYDFLAHLGTVHAFEDFTAVDLKLLFNFQSRDDAGYTWGFLPFLFENACERDLRKDLRFVRFPGHALAGWSNDEGGGFEVLSPFLFSRERRAITDDEGKSNGDRVDTEIGPFGLLFDWESRTAGKVEHDSLFGLLHDYEHRPREKGEDLTEFSLGPFGLLYAYEDRKDGGAEQGMLWDLLWCYDNERNKDGGFDRHFGLGPFGCCSIWTGKRGKGWTIDSSCSSVTRKTKAISRGFPGHSLREVLI